ncbi:MAG: helix-turn-helix domain-containing protein, partial [Hyphomicrobium sp.]
LRVCVGQIRQKLKSTPEAPEFIETEVGIGYRFKVSAT